MPGPHDSFDEDKAEFQKLHETPTCFVIIGKPGSGKSTLARNLAHYWKCKLVTPESAIEWAVKQDSDLGSEVSDRLNHGQAIPEALTLKIVSQRIAALDIKHHGYVLDGLPTLDSEFMSTEEQVSVIKNFELTPEFIINIKITDADLIARRSKQLLYPENNELYSPDLIQPAAEVDEDEEEDVEEEEEEDEMEDDADPDAIPEQVYELIDPPAPAGALELMIRRPQDELDMIKKEIETYFSNVLPSLEDFIISHDRQKVIELNGLLGRKDLLNTLMNKLATYCAYCAIQPIPLFPDDEEQDPDLEADDLLKMLVKRDTVGARFPWRKSRWEASDPVALQQGSIQQGKFQFSVAYLGKIYCMSSDENMKKFMENPRPYLLPPQPRIPAKICIIGPPSSGKSTICKMLCEHYSAALLDMNVLAADVRETEQQKHVDQVRDDAKVTFLNQIREQIQNAAQLVIESRTRRAMLAAEMAEEGELEGGNPGTTIGEGVESEESTMQEKMAQEKEELERENDLIKKFGFTFDEEGQIILPEITEEHPLVREQVERVTVEARNHEVEISPEMYCSVLEEAIRGVITGHQTKGDPDFGGWILDNFPLTRDQWTMMTERADKLLTPDSFIILNDPDPESGELLRRWATIQKPPITLTDAQIKAVEKKKAKPASEKTGDGLAPLDESEEQENAQDKVPASVEQRVLNRKAFDREKPQLEAIIKQSDVELLTIECNKPLDTMKDDAVVKLDAVFRYKAVDYFSYEEEEQEEEEEDEEEEVDKRNLGETRHYCPVTLLEKDVLWPGDHEIGARFREKIYLFSSPDCKTKFLESPEKYAPSDAPLVPPPIRLCILGPKSCGKTEQGRSLARKLGLFHISFHKFLEEMIIPKVKVRAWESDHEEEPPASPDEGDDDDEVDEETKEKKMAMEIAKNTKAVDLDDSLLQTPSGKDYLVAEFTENTIVQFEKALQVRRALIAKRTGKSANTEEALNELEEAVHNSLVEGEALPPEILEQIVVSWWTENPFKETGFILEGFPRTPQEATFMTDTGLFPDACIILEVEDEHAGDRQLPGKLQKWKNKMAKKLARRQRHQERRRIKKEKERKKKIQEKFEELKAERNVRLEERRKEKEEAAKFGEVPESDGEESEEEPEIELKDVVLSDEEDEDDEDDMEGEDDETEEEAVDRIRGEISDRYDTDMQVISQLQNTLEDLNIPRIMIDASRKPKVVFYSLCQQLRSITDFRESLFSQCLAVRARQANEMLAKGYKQSSRFGRWDPVELEQGCAIQPYQAPGRLTYPVVFRAHTYFMSSLENRQKFMDNPLHYLKLSNPPPVVPVKLAIVGPPKSGKTMLARRLERDHGIVCLSAGEAVRQFMVDFPTSSLTKEMETHLKAGVTLPDALVVEALEAIMLSQRCQTRGYVLDGYPNTIEQVKLMTELCIIPVQIIELTLSAKEVHWRGTADRHSPDRALPLHDSAPILDVRLSSYKRNIDVVRSHYQKEHRNWYVLEGNRSKWWLNNKCAELMNEQLKTAQHYLSKRNVGDAASIFGLCVSPDECKNRLGEFSHYCPVSLATKHELVDCSYETTMKFTAEYRARYYKLAGQTELDMFLAEAHKYVSPTAPHMLPDSLPRYVTKGEVKQMFPKELAFRGYCPVTYVLGNKRYEALTPGSRDHVVLYDDELFSMLDDKSMEMFLRQPWKYNRTPLPAKLPPARVAQDVTSLPMLGYMEQTVAKAIIAAMTSCSDFKPKYPYVNAHKSALLYVGYHLKAHNPKATEYSREKYRKKLEKFKEHCDLIKYLGHNMNRKYKPEPDRPIDFNYKMDEFLALKSYPLPIH